MAIPSQLQGDFEFPGTVRITGTATLPDGTITNAMVSASAAFAHTKLEHRYQASHILESTAAVIQASKHIFHAYRPCTVLGGAAVVETIADSTGRVVTVDILKSTAGSTYSSILSASLTFNSTNATARTPKAFSLSGTPTLLQGDILKTSITVAGSTGTQAKGLGVFLNLYEDPA